MNFLIGLGNPGPDYQNTRHNAGAQLTSFFAQQHNIRLKGVKKTKSLVGKNEQWLISIPQTYMNQSGLAARATLDYFGSGQQQDLPNTFICFDDLDLTLGAYKIQFGTGPKAHNGLTDVIQQLGTDKFWHVRIGVDSRGIDRHMSGKDYVLQQFLPDEKEQIAAVFEQISLKLTSHL